MSYEATDHDLPSAMFSEPPEEPKPNRVQTARLRILTVGAEMGVTLSFEEIQKFGIVFCGLQDDEQESAKKDAD